MPTHRRDARRRRYMAKLIRTGGVGTLYRPRQPLPDGAPSGLTIIPVEGDPKAELPVFELDRALDKALLQLRKRSGRRGRPRGRTI